MIARATRNTSETVTVSYKIKEKILFKVQAANPQGYQRTSVSIFLAYTSFFNFFFNKNKAYCSFKNVDEPSYSLGQYCTTME